MKKQLSRILAVILSCLMLMSALAVSPFAAEGTTPYRVSVCIKGDAQSSRGFCWYTAENTATVAELFADGVDVSSQLTFSDEVCEQWKGNYVHKLTVSGMSAGTTYTYRVGDGTTWSDEGTFTTDNGDDSFSFITIADVQASSLENFSKGADTLTAAFATAPESEFVVNLGDFTNDSTNEEWDFYDEAFTQLNLSSTLVPVAGNHDGLGVWHWFDNMFNLDTSKSVQKLNGLNYSFDYGNAHIAVLNTNDLLSVSTAQLEWLKNDMNSTSQDWKLVFMHKSPYTLGKDGKWPDALYLQDALAATLDSCGVDLVMSGHDHMYLRTKTLYNNSVSEDGTVYVLAGTAGSKRYEVRSFLADSFLKTDFIDAMTIQKSGYGNYWNGTDWSSTSEANVGGCFSCVSVDGGSLTLKAYILADEKAEDGSDVITNIDTMTLTKPVGQNSPTYSGDNSVGTLEYAAGTIPSIFRLLGYTLTQWLPKFLSILPEIIRIYIEEGTF